MFAWDPWTRLNGPEKTVDRLAIWGTGSSLMHVAGWRSPCKKNEQERSMHSFHLKRIACAEKCTSPTCTWSGTGPLLAEFEHVRDIHYAAYQSLSLSLSLSLFLSLESGAQ